MKDAPASSEFGKSLLKRTQCWVSRSSLQIFRQLLDKLLRTFVLIRKASLLWFLQLSEGISLHLLLIFVFFKRKFWLVKLENGEFKQFSKWVNMLIRWRTFIFSFQRNCSWYIHNNLNLQLVWYLPAHFYFHLIHCFFSFLWWNLMMLQHS